MLKIVVVGHNQERLRCIKEEIKPLHECYKELRVSSARPVYLETVLDPKLKLLIFDTRTLDSLIFPFVAQVRKSGYLGPILMVGNLSFGFAATELTGKNNIFHLDKPYEVDQLLGLAKNCIDLEQMKQRRDQRFDVREQAIIEAYRSDLKLETLINNISRSGVRIEGDLDGLRKGDLLRVHFNFDKIQKERIMSARVVWLKKESDTKEEAGLEFVSQKTVYRYLLDYAVA